MRVEINGRESGGRDNGIAAADYINSIEVTTHKIKPVKSFQRN